jgi:hypothetical protein
VRSLSRLRRPSSRDALRRAAAALAAAAAFYALPATLGFAFGGRGWWYALPAANVLGLAAVAIWRWSPLSVLGGRAFLWRFPLAWLAAGIWIGVWAHIIPGGVGGCFE